MTHNFLQKIINRLRGPNYTLDPKITNYELLSVSCSRFLYLLRGFRIKFLFKKYDKYFFLGRNVSIRCKHRIEIGRGVTFGDRVDIDGLCQNGIKIGNFVTIRADTVIDSGLLNNIGEGLVIGDRVGISQKCFLQISGTLKIGNDVIIGPNSSIFTENHNFDDLDIPIRNQGVKRRPTIVNNGVWIGSGATILAGVILGEGCIVAANSVVTKNVEPYGIVAGAPAILIKKRLAQL